MFARRQGRLVALTLGLITGCIAPGSGSGPRSDRPAREEPPSEPPQIVDSNAGNDVSTASDDAVAAGVNDYIKRVEAAYEQRPAAPDAVAAPPPPPESQPASESTVDPRAEQPNAVPPEPRVRIIPESAAPPAAIQAVPEPEPQPQAPPPKPSPPSVTGVRVLAGAPQPNAVPDVDPSAPAVGINQAVTAPQAMPSLADLLAATPLPDDAGVRAQIERRLLAVLAGDYELARSPLPLATPEQQALATRLVESWIALRDARSPDLVDGAMAAASELAALERTLRTIAGVRIPNTRICSAVRGFGQFDELRPARFVTGRPVEFVLYVEVADFLSRREGDEWVTKFDLRTTILTAAGDVVTTIDDAGLVDRCQAQRRDCFLPRLVRLPATLSPGRYVAKVTLVDTLAQKVAESRATFEVAIGR